MNHPVLWILALMEIIIVMAVMMLHLYRQNQSLMATSGTAARHPGAPDMHDPWHDFLQEEINRTRTRITQLANDGITPVRNLEVLELRLKALQAEQQAWNRTSEDHEVFWEQITTQLSALLPAATDASTNNAQAAAEDPVKDELIRSMQERIENYEARLGNLETFKQMFFDLKQKLNESQELNQQFHDEITRTIPVEMQSPEMQAMLERLREENTALEEQLQHVEKQLYIIMHHAGHTTTTGGKDHGAEPETSKQRLDSMSDVAMHIETEMTQIRDIISNQKRKISELTSHIDELQLEVNEKDHIKRELVKLADRNEEMNRVLDVLEEENTFLQEQISALLRQELRDSERSKENLSEYENQLLAKEKALNALEKKYTDMEQEYLTVYNENEKLKQKSA